MAQAGLCSRREADRLIEQGRVYVNGTVAGLGCLVGASDKVQIGKKEIKGAARKVLIAFYKPVGVTCTEKDRFADKKILDYVKTKTRVTYAGRLDKDSEGLMLLTNDGELIQKLMRGAEKHEKEEEKIGEGRKKQWLRGSFNGKIVPLCLDMCLLAQGQ